jgi:acyl-CoA reductase-like NAD-dependent aldehyde dehydrogenase
VTSWHEERLLIDGQTVPSANKQSGIGREMGGAGLAEFLELKTFAEPAS